MLLDELAFSAFQLAIPFSFSARVFEQADATDGCQGLFVEESDGGHIDAD